MTIFRSILAWVVAVGCVAGGGLAWAEGSQSNATTRPAAEDAREAREPLTLDGFESGTVQIADTAPEQLEEFIQRMNRLKDADYAANNGPGPLSARLWKWISAAVAHLEAQGYQVNEYGNLVRPDGTIILCR